MNVDPNPPTILLVEDDPNVAEALRESLEEAGFRAEVAQDGTEVMDRIRRRRPDVVVLDLVLPGLSGVEIAETLKRDPENEALPIIAATATWLGSKPEWLMAAGFSSALRKPFTPGRLIEEIESLLAAGSRPASGVRSRFRSAGARGA